MKALDPALLPLAVIIREPGDDAPATQASAPSQMPLMVLPTHVQRQPAKVRGHAAVPGTGPSGETCGSCEHLFRNRMSKVYLKCGLTRSKWTGGAGTDMKARDAACVKWKQKPNQREGV